MVKGVRAYAYDLGGVTISTAQLGLMPLQSRRSRRTASTWWGQPFGSNGRISAGEAGERTRNGGPPWTTPTLSPRDRIARALWIKRAGQTLVSQKDWPAVWAWHEREMASADHSAVYASAVGRAIRQAEQILRLLDAVGLEVRDARNASAAENEGVAAGLLP